MVNVDATNITERGDQSIFYGVRESKSNAGKLNRFFYIPPLILQTIVWPLTWFLFHFFGHLSVRGLSNLKDLDRGVIFASNHSNELEPVLLPASLPFLSRLMPMFYTSREHKFYTDFGWRKYIYGGTFFKLWGGISGFNRIA